MMAKMHKEDMDDVKIEAKVRKAHRRSTDKFCSIYATCYVYANSFLTRLNNILLEQFYRILTLIPLMMRSGGTS
jgi:hypothetical protein